MKSYIESHIKLLICGMLKYMLTILLSTGSVCMVNRCSVISLQAEKSDRRYTWSCFMYGSSPKASGTRIPVESHEPQRNSDNIHESA